MIREPNRTATPTLESSQTATQNESLQTERFSDFRHLKFRFGRGLVISSFIVPRGTFDTQSLNLLKVLFNGVDRPNLNRLTATSSDSNRFEPTPSRLELLRVTNTVNAHYITFECYLSHLPY